MTENVTKRSGNPEYRFRLFIAGMNPTSIRAVENIRGICDRQLNGNYDLEVIDIYQQRDLVKEMNVIAVPTLIRLFPQPERRIMGDMREVEKVTQIMEINPD